MAKRSGLADLIGRQIVAVTVKESEKPPRLQLFLTLDDGRYFELWSNDPETGFASMTRDGGLEAVRSYGRQTSEVVFEVVTDDDGEPLQTVVTEERDLIERRKSLMRGNDGPSSKARRG